MNLTETYRIGNRFPMVGDEDFHQAGMLIALTTQDVLQADHAWQKVNEDYGYTTAHQEGATDELTIIMDQLPRFMTLVQQYLLPDEQKAVWGWLHGKPKTTEVQDALDVLDLMTLDL